MVYARRASDKCSKEKRKTINGDDLLWAMSALGFEEYVEPLKMYLHKYREVSLLNTCLFGAVIFPFMSLTVYCLNRVRRLHWQSKGRRQMA